MVNAPAVAAALATLAVAACAAPAPAPRTEWRVLVELARPAADGEAVARHASEVGGVAVRHAAAADPARHALLLQCADERECESALARLRADVHSFRSVDRDERRRRHDPP